MNPASGPTPAGTAISATTKFLLSPGDTAHITSRFIIDEGTGIPFAEIPPLPNLADGPYFNVINVNSPETSLGNDLSIGAQTQLNLMAGGSIGTNFSAGDPLFATPDIEVNISGGTMGDDYRAYNQSVTNISDGSTVDVFLLGGSTANVTGGNVGGVLRAFDGKINVSGGDVAGLRIDEGQINVTGGTVSTFGVHASGGVTNIAGGTINNPTSTAVRLDGGTVNITGGTISGNCGVCATAAGAGSVVHITGGSISGAANGNGIITIAGTETVLNIYGGTVTPRIIVRADNEIHFFGTEFLLGGEEVEGLIYGQPFEITERNVTLTGMLADGTPLNIDLNTVETAGVDAISADALLTVTLKLLGDYNEDGTVSAADYTVWRNTLGQSVAAGTGADGSGPGGVPDGIIDRLDYDHWKSRYGATLPGAGSGASLAESNVPEPSCAALLLATLIFLSANVELRQQRHNH